MGRVKMMSNSPLINYTKISPNSSKPRNKPISKITIHHMAGDLTVESCGNVFSSSNRQASANYGIGTDGRVGLYVEEKDRAWTSSNAGNDNQAVTIIVANDQLGGDWHVSGKALNKLIDLCVDICNRNGITELVYTGDATGNLTRHNMFVATECPGAYLQNKFPYIEQEVNKRLTGGAMRSESLGEISAITIAYAENIICVNEGGYGSINRDDNGAVSVGKIQWHAERALSLLKSIVSKNIEKAKELLGSALFDEITSSSADWDKRVVTGDEASRLSAILLTNDGKEVQDGLVKEDIQGYIEKGKSYGLIDPGALIYFADGVNQYGTNSSLWKKIAERALEAAGDVTAMFEATKALASEYLDRRESVYKSILALKLSGGGQAQYPVRITVDGLSIRKGPGDGYPINGAITDGGVYTIVEEAQGPGAEKWGKLKSGAGWVPLDGATRL
ncbi:MAG: N-acetylmuramoyl-L-alanine amidase [Clostridiales bacterium]|jgi:hypothetical protein|nr:N-acetylmuramoyl-L-alanine amidase [Clostridiales bacterium]